MSRTLSRSSIKEAFDHLPAGICFFNASSLPVLCNHQMDRLLFELTGRDLQQLSDITDALEWSDRKEDKVIYLPDKTAWLFQASDIKAETSYTQVVALDVTELTDRKKELEHKNETYKEMLANIRVISDNVVAITREEELLTLKMHIHGQIGMCLQKLGRFLSEEDVLQQKAAIVSALRDVTGILEKEMDNDDEVSEPMEAIIQVAKEIGVTVKVEGEIPKQTQTALLLASAVRECVTNTRRHASGDEVTVKIRSQTGCLTAVITNNGNVPSEEIREGGGLSSLRTRIEKSGGQMKIQGFPYFALTVIIPDREEEMLYHV